jgi:hypothetical protein
LISADFEEAAMRKRASIVTLAVLATGPAISDSSLPANLRGIWKGDSESVITDSGNAHHAETPQSPKPHVSSVAFTLKIDHQDGRRFWGTFSSARLTESVIGVISRNGALYFVDIKGYSFGTLLAPDRLEMCYLQTASSGRVASCTELTKQP